MELTPNMYVFDRTDPSIHNLDSAKKFARAKEIIDETSSAMDAFKRNDQVEGVDLTLKKGLVVVNNADLMADAGKFTGFSTDDNFGRAKFEAEEAPRKEGDPKKTLFFEDRDKSNVYVISQQVGDTVTREAVIQNKQTGVLTMIPNTDMVNETDFRNLTFIKPY